MRQDFFVEIATVTNSEIRGDNSLYIVALSPSESLLHTIKKISSKKSQTLPDIFDDISIKGEMSSPTSLKFVSNFEILKRRIKIASNYSAFENASMILDIVNKNGKHIDDSKTLFKNLRASLDSIENGSPAEIVRLKFLYILAKNEGYPIKEDFYKNLNINNKQILSTIIKTPSTQLNEMKVDAINLVNLLNIWLKKQTDIIVDF